LIQEKESQAKSLAGKQVRYDEFMSACQNAIADKNWELARSSCGAASELLPEEQLPKSRLSEIDQLEKNHQVGLAQIEFELAVSKADDAFLRKNYEKALSFYDKALGFKPDNVHCMARKIKIHEILNAPEEVKEEEKLAERKVEEETKDEGNAKITIRKVTVGEKVDVYKKVIYSWGGKYYFLNDQPVTELVWTRETAQ
jgi:tetratricopeptide (TPR) repeat protein